MKNGGDDSLYEDLERRALFDMPDEEPGDDHAPDLVGSLRGDAPAGVDKDVTLGGYVEKHDRVPAFEGSDGQPYTVDVDVVRDGEGDAPYAAFLVFIRWAATGAGIMDHVESGDVARGSTDEDARRAAMDLSLYEVKAELDAAIERRRMALEE
jgi:predicted RNA-binding protein with TRAM domain